FCLIRLTSVGPRIDAFRRDRLRLALLPCIKWRLPAPRNMTLPVPVILKRFVTDFFVLIPLGRRIIISFVNECLDSWSQLSKFRPVFRVAPQSFGSTAF